MNIIEYIFASLFLVSIAIGCFGIFWFVVIRPICNFIICNKKDADLEWKCVANRHSREEFIRGGKDYLECDLMYRVNPNQFNAFVRIFGDNDWEYFNSEPINFKKREEFVDYVSNFKKLNEVKAFKDADSMLWRWP